MQHRRPLLQRGGVQSQQPLSHMSARLIQTHLVRSREYVHGKRCTLFLIWFVSQLLHITRNLDYTEHDVGLT